MNEYGRITRIYMTPGGMKRLKSKIDAARDAYLKICDDNEAAADSGDTSVWHDNFAYEENQRQMHMLSRRVRDLERIWSAAEVVPMREGEPRKAGIGTWVHIAYEDDGEEEEFWISGYDDSDAGRSRIAYNTAIGKALLGAEVGDVREIRLPGGTRRMEVLAIRPATAADDEK